MEVGHLDVSKKQRVDIIDEYRTDEGVLVETVLIKDGEVDGRDLYFDGNKLDGIESFATRDQTQSDIESLHISHLSLNTVTSDQHHNEVHTIVSHDTNATGSELNELTDGSQSILHSHPIDGISDSFELGENLIAGDPVYEYDDSGGKIKKVHSNLNDVESEYNGYYHYSCTISDNKIIVGFRNSNDSYYLGVICGDVQSDNTIIWGSATRVIALSGYYIHVDKLDTDKFIFTARGTGNRGSAWVGTVVGNIITMSAEQQFTSVTTSYITNCAIGTDKFVVGYRGLSNYSYCRVGSVSGTTITFGTEVSFSLIACYENFVCSTGIDDKFAVFYRANLGSGNLGYVKCSLVSGTTISGFSVETECTFSYSYFMHAECIDTDKIALVWIDLDGYTYKGNVIVGTFVGTTPHFSRGDRITFDNERSYYPALLKLDTNVFVCAWGDITAPYSGKLTKFTASGTTVSQGFVQVFQEITYAGYNTMCLLTNGRYFLAWRYTSCNYLVIDEDVNTLNQTIGILRETGLLGETKIVDLLGGITEQLSGMTPGAIQYIQRDASISEVVSNYIIGISLTSTKMLITKNPYGV